jgi:cell division septation protein DedD
MVAGEEVVISPMPQIEMLQPVSSVEPSVSSDVASISQEDMETSDTVIAPVISIENKQDGNVIIEQPAPVPVEVNSEPALQEVSPSSSISFHVIVGSYKNRSNAKRMVRELRSQGIDSEMIHRQDGHYLVSVFSTPSEQSAENQLPTFRTQIIASAWVFEYTEKE